MPFSAEKKISKKLKELKVAYAKVKEAGIVLEEIQSVSADFSGKRKKAQESHHEVQKKAQESQERHQEIQKLYDAMKGLREEEKPLAKKYFDLKKVYEETRSKLNALQKEVTELSGKVNEQEEKSYNTMAREKKAEVKEKMKKGKKLSTEDILAFQAMKD